MDMTRPRRASGTIIWMRVLLEAICTIMAKPTGSMRSTESGKARDIEKAMRATPNSDAQPAIQVPRPFGLGRIARVTAPARAPIPEAPMRVPRALGPPWRIRSAKMGMSTL